MAFERNVRDLIFLDQSRHTSWFMPLILTFLTHVVIDARTQEHVSTHASAYEARGSFIEEQKDEWVKEADVIHNKCHSRGHVLSIATWIFEHSFFYHHLIIHQRCTSEFRNFIFILFASHFFNRILVFFLYKINCIILMKSIFLNNIYNKSKQQEKRRKKIQNEFITF